MSLREQIERWLSAPDPPSEGKSAGPSAETRPPVDAVTPEKEHVEPAAPVAFDRGCCPKCGSKLWKEVGGAGMRCAQCGAQSVVQQAIGVSRRDYELGNYDKRSPKMNSEGLNRVSPRPASELARNHHGNP